MDYSKRYRVRPGEKRPLDRIDPADTGDQTDKSHAARALEKGVERLASLQEKLYASNTWSLLVVFQAMDAAGKDSTIKHVMSGVNPQGCQVFSFKAPSSEELDHDYLWRSVRALPERGRIGIHNRSYYEEVLVTRVHPELLEKQQLPEKPGRDLWARRFKAIVNFERHLVDNGTAIVKCFLHISKDEQRKRFLERLNDPEKNWKFSLGDVQERAHWDDYMASYADMLQHTSTTFAPWYVVPADHKWFTRLAVADIIGDRLEAMGLKFPTVPRSVRDGWRLARRALAQ